jgi:biotin carboxyl carrier protein
VVDVKVSPGDVASKGQPLVILEAMKMENILTAPRDGIVENVHHKVGDTVTVGETIIDFIETLPGLPGE